MIEVLDRVPTYPGRVTMTPVAGQENTYDMVRADAPLEVGTPINKALFESIRKDITALQTNVSDIINEHAFKTNISNVIAGTEFVLFEGGIRVPFIKLAGEYGGTGRSLVVRKHSYKEARLTQPRSAAWNKYEGGETDVWLNDETAGYLAQLDPSILTAIAAVPVETSEGGDYPAMSTIQRKAFLLSMNEYGIPMEQSTHHEGDTVAYFSSDDRRVAQYNGAADDHWTRTPVYGDSDRSICITRTGDYNFRDANNYIAGIRPAFTLPADFEIDLSVPNTGNTMATAEVI
jgi:hypothetical protein